MSQIKKNRPLAAFLLFKSYAPRGGAVGHPMYLRYMKILLFFMVMLYSVGVSSAGTEDAAVSDLVVINSSDTLYVYFSVDHAFTPEMENAVKSGIPAIFTFYVELYKIRKNWPDKKIVEHTFEHVLSWNTLKEEFTVTLEEGKNHPYTLKSLADAKKMMSDVSELTVTPLDILEEEGDYELRVKARLNQKTLPLKLHYLIPFYSLWDFNTDWAVLPFRY